MLRTGPNGAKTGIGLNITNLFDPDAVFPSMRRRGYATAIFVSASIELILLLATTRACAIDASCLAGQDPQRTGGLALQPRQPQRAV